MLEQEGHNDNEKEVVKKFFRNTQNQVIVTFAKIYGYKEYSANVLTSALVLLTWK